MSSTGPGPLRLSRSDNTDGRVVITIAGDLDYETAAALRDLLGEVLAQRPRELLMHVAGVDFIDSSGLGLIVGAWQEGRRTGTTVALAAVPPMLADLLDITGLDAVLTIGGHGRHLAA